MKTVRDVGTWQAYCACLCTVTSSPKRKRVRMRTATVCRRQAVIVCYLAGNNLCVKNCLILTEIKRVRQLFRHHAIGDSILRISFNQQQVSETKNPYTESQGINGRDQAGRAHAGKNHPAQGAVSGESIYAPGLGRNGLPGNGAEKGKSLIELQQEAESADVGISQDYMTVMSHTLSEEDYAKAKEEGFDFGNMNPEETVTIVDKIKAELVRAGKKIAGYTDDLDMETLAAALGSQVLAEAVAESFRQADLPLTEENLELTKSAWMMAAELQPLDQGSIRYLIDNEMSSEIWNLYVAENSGAAGIKREKDRSYN